MSKAIRFRNKNNEPVYPCPFYPIGSIYISVDSINPSTYFGGTWERFAKGRTLVGVDDSVGDPNLTQVQKTGGEYYHKLSFNEMPPHQHDIVYGFATSTNGVTISNTGSGKNVLNLGSWNWTYNNDNGYAGRGNNIFASAEGGGQSHNNMQPYITVYMWRRTK